MKEIFFKFWALVLVIWPVLVVIALLLKQFSFLEISILILIGILSLIVIRMEMYDILGEHRRDMEEFLENEKKRKYD